MNTVVHIMLWLGSYIWWNDSQKLFENDKRFAGWCHLVVSAAVAAFAVL